MFENLESSIEALIVNVVAGFLTLFITGLIRYFYLKRLHALQGSRRKQEYLLIGFFSALISSMSAILIVHWIQTPPRARPVFSDFGYCTPVDNYNVQWGVFNDNPYNGNSNAGIKAVGYSSDSQDCFGLVTFNLGSTSSIPPYTGIVSGFSARLRAKRDVSHYSGVALHIWHKDRFPHGVRVYLELAPAQMSDSYDGHFDYDITESAKKQQPSPEVFVPFAVFVPSPPLVASGFSGGFDKPLQRQLYLLAIVIKGESGVASQGNVAVDNIRFY